MMRHTIYLPGKESGYIQVPDNLDEEDIALVESAVASLKLYAKRAAGGQRDKE